MRDSVTHGVCTLLKFAQDKLQQKDKALSHKEVFA